MTKKLTPEEKAANLAARRAKAGKAPDGKRAKPEKAAKKKKAEKVTQLRAVKKKAAPGEKGHNSGQINEALQEIFSDYAKLDQDAKVISKAKRDLRARAKEEHNVASSVFNHEVRLQKLETDQRVMFESGCKDLKDMLGIQLALDLAGEHDEEDEDGEDDDTPDPLEAGSRAASH